MAGRAGRSAKYPTGRVLFVGEQINGEMKNALEHIKTMNIEASQKGYLYNSGS
jgi:competence protein ComFA